MQMTQALKDLTDVVEQTKIKHIETIEARRLASFVHSSAEEVYKRAELALAAAMQRLREAKSDEATANSYANIAMHNYMIESVKINGEVTL